MKKIFKKISLLLLICFSFFYTDKVIDLINSKDPLMVELVSSIDDYEIVSIDAVVTDDTIIPGIKGKTVDLAKSYENMKVGGVFREESLVYTYLYPCNSLINNKDKYIIKGNFSRKEVSLLFIVDSYDDIDKVKDIGNISLFIESKFLTINNIKRLKNNEIYSYGKNGLYSDFILNGDNSLINKISNNKSIYCLSINKDNEVLDVCNNNDMYVVVPNIVGNYLEIKNSLSNGSIILLNNINDIDIIIKYIKGKGYDIVPLSKLLQE